MTRLPGRSRVEILGDPFEGEVGLFGEETSDHRFAFVTFAERG